MKIARDGVVEKIGRRELSGTWYMVVKTDDGYQTYAGFIKRPLLKVGDIVKAENEIAVKGGTK